MEARAAQGCRARGGGGGAWFLSCEKSAPHGPWKRSACRPLPPSRAADELPETTLFKQLFKVVQTTTRSSTPVSPAAWGLLAALAACPARPCPPQAPTPGGPFPGEWGVREEGAEL